VLNDVEPKSVQPGHRLGMIGHQTQLRKAKVAQNLTTDAKEARVLGVEEPRAARGACYRAESVEAPWARDEGPARGRSGRSGAVP
jgi:hypothetical protein